MHLVGFTIEINGGARSYERQMSGKHFVPKFTFLSITDITLF
jgi:hypothetical protein